MQPPIHRNPLVSVIMPTYNRGDKISVAIDSVLAQTYQPLELIVVDDGSVDNTAEFISNKYPSVQYVLIPHAGQSAARNKGLSVASGAIVASLDSDDQWAPDFLDTCVPELESRQLDFVFTNWIQQYPGGVNKDFLSFDPELKNYIRHPGATWETMDAADLRALYLRACPSPSSAAVMRKSSIVAGWNEKIRIADDWCMFFDMVMAKPCTAAFTLDVHWNKFLNANNIYDGRTRSELLELFHIQDTQEFMRRFGSRLSPKEFSVLTKRCTRGFVELAKHHLIKGFHVSKSAALIARAFKLHAGDTLLAIPDVLFFGIQRRVKDRIAALKKRSPNL